MSFKDNLKSELEYQDIQLKELAAMTGISKNTLANYLTGHNSIPGVEAAAKIASALGVTMEYLVTGKNSNTNEITLPPHIRKITDYLLKFDDLDIAAVTALVDAMNNRYQA